MVLLERDEQLRAAASYLAEAAQGHGRLAYVAGEAGIGKTVFVEHVMAQADSPVRGAMGWCDGSVTPPPLGPLMDMLPALPADVWPAGASRQDVFSQLLAVLRGKPGQSPLILVIEDMHWADEATLDLLRHLARRIHNCRAFVMVTYRPEENSRGHALRQLLGDTATANGTRRIDLPPLTPGAVAMLAAAHPESVGADELHRLTGGNPFFVTEALSAATTELPQTVRDAVLARVSRLDPRSQRALEVVALAGSRADSGLLDDLLSPGLAALDEAIARGVLSQSGHDIVFRHELARLVLAEEIPVGRRVHIHRRLLAALRAHDGDPAMIAHHAQEAGDADAVLLYAPRAAAHAAELGAHQEALGQYRRALQAVDQQPTSVRAELLWNLGYECYLTGQIDTAIESIRAAQEIWEVTGDTLRIGDAWRCQSRLNWFAGRNREAEDQAAMAVDLLDGTVSVELALALSHRASMFMLASNLADTRQWGQRTFELLERLPPGLDVEGARSHALNNVGTIEIVAGDLDRGRELLTQSLRVATSHNLQEHAARAYCNLGSSAVLQRRYDEAARYLEEGITYCLDRDLDSWRFYLVGWRARFNLDRGRTTEAGRDADSVLGRPHRDAVGSLEPLLVKAQLEVRAGDLAGFDRLIQAAAMAHRMGETQRLAPTTYARCEAAWIAGEDSGPEWAKAAWLTVEKSDCPWNAGMVATWLPPDVRVTTTLAPPYQWERAGQWVEAAQWWESVGNSFEQGLALARSGEVRLIAEAVRIFDRHGAVAAAARARSCLRSVGIVPPRAMKSRSRLDGLTAREIEVRALAACGLSDQQIADRLVISRRTAEHHVAAVLAKLGVNSRRELVDLGSRTGSDG